VSATGADPGTHTVKIEFLNNLVNSTCDRNLYLDKVTLQQADNQPGLGYPRPKGATPVFVPLVPAFADCVSPNGTHGGGLSGGSCKPPAQTSTSLTVGTPDSNGAASNMTGFVRFGVCSGSGCGAADVAITASVTDVRCKAGAAPCGPANSVAGSDYAGELQANAALRITDRVNGAAGTEAGTVSDTSFPVTVPCTATSADTSEGGICSVTTSANTVIPGSVPAGARTIWQLGQVTVYDGGPDGDVDTAAGNTVFLHQGLFTP
jgi:hypothetical protein